MKKSKMTKSNQQNKILRMIARNEQIERNGGGQFVAMNRVYKDKTKYNRKDKKKELRNELSSYFLSHWREIIIICFQIHSFLGVII